MGTSSLTKSAEESIQDGDANCFARMKCHEFVEFISEEGELISEAVESLPKVFESSTEVVASEAVGEISKGFERSSKVVAVFSEAFEPGAKALELESEVRESLSAGAESISAVKQGELFPVAP